MGLEQTSLGLYLKEKSPAYWGRLLELRDAVGGWLSYIPETFPHYTRHTLPHSEQIILRLSQLMFEDDFAQPTVHLSAAEAYILMAAAYLHDAGMVVSNREKARILESDQWTRWTSAEGGGKRRWDQVNALRNNTDFDTDIRNFMADVQMRFLIAEFIRLTHHSRTTDILTCHQDSLARFAFDEPLLLRTVSDVCAAHGLQQYELEDNDRFPERRTIRGDRVNVRFMALLLRLGDLLDMSYDRACPLLLNAASPLPADSLAHWSQYQRINHELVAPDRIEFIAECDTQEEHRTIQDWCQWLVQETHGAGRIMSRAARHGNWKPPAISIGGDAATISIRPSRRANYFPSKWQFQLDPDIVMQRLVRDVHATPIAFAKELIQNSLDATRCQMYLELEKEGIQGPEYPTQVDERYRLRYPLEVTLGTTERVNPLSGETETSQVLTIDDKGIGMDRHVIEHYLLQIGRSYYNADEFRRQFPFTPTSRFGIGFLSVFAVSDYVTIETYKPTSAQSASPIRLVLTGPRNYLLTETGKRPTNGTCVEVLLREPLKPGSLTQSLLAWCRRVEFPVHVDDLGQRTVIHAERKEQFIEEVPHVRTPGAVFAIRAFPLNQPGIEGEFYVLTYEDEQGESWVHAHELRTRYLPENPMARIPELPESLVCINGITLLTSHYSRPAHRVDYRRFVGDLPLSREQGFQTFFRWHVSPESRILHQWQQIMKDHLSSTKCAQGPEGWRYLQRCAALYPIPGFWVSMPGMIRGFLRGKEVLLSLEDIRCMDQLTTTVATIDGRPRQRGFQGPHVSPNPSADNNLLVLTDADLRALGDNERSDIFRFKKRFARNVRWLDSVHLAIDWAVADCAPESACTLPWMPNAFVTALPDSSTVGFSIHSTSEESYQRTQLLNPKNPLVEWLLNLWKDAQKGLCPLDTSEFRRIGLLLNDPVDYRGYRLEGLLTYIARFRELGNVPKEYLPPQFTLNRDDFDIGIRFP